MRLNSLSQAHQQQLPALTVRVGSGPEGWLVGPPHRHEFTESFLVREGTLTICEEHDGTVVPTHEVPTVRQLPGAPVGRSRTLNLTDGDVRFQAVWQPGLMSGYFV